MKASIFYKRGGLDVLQYDDVPEPKLAAGEILVRVRACGVNHLDIYTREGSHGVKAPLPHIGGLEPSGEVAAVGPGVQDWQVGERVLVGAFTSDGTCELCLAGDDNLCINRKIIGVSVDGGFAEYLSVPASAGIRLPDNISYLEASAIPAAFGTAWHMLNFRAKVKPDEWVLVLAVGSGVGSAAVQIAKHLGAKVIATSSSDEKLQMAQQWGADAVINYNRHPNFQHEVRRITNGRMVDVVFEHVGQSTWKQSIASLRATGRLVTCGGSSGRWGETDIWGVFWQQLTLMGSNGCTHREFYQVLDLYARGDFRAVIDRTFPLSELAAAQQYLLDRKQFGKVVVVPD
ncbi:MAG TPA: zinc-binding dehydrogenase [Anaerolineae bacterium]|nr:zinc-binding dehydrogenase [Anaerolineae bacterium]